MKVTIEIDSEELKRLVITKIEDTLGSVALDNSKVRILVKSKQNYKADWESGDFKAVYETL